MVEQGTHKPLVGGSKSALRYQPATPTTAPDVAEAARPRSIRLGGGRVLLSGRDDGLRGSPKGPTLYSRRWRVPSAHRRHGFPRRRFLNAKFFRNGIVMLVLVVGTVALLYTWLIQGTPGTPTGYSQFLADVQSGRVQKVIQQDQIADRHLQRRLDQAGHRPEHPDRGLPGHAARGSGRATRRSRPTSSPARRRPTRRGSGYC